jgi:DNA-binding GntR family transcriptional regulator
LAGTTPTRDASATEFSRVETPPTRTDWAESLLRRDILAGRLRPGERIKIAELLVRHPGLSATPLREALSRLAGAGLVKFVPQRGVRVAAGSREDLADAYELRKLLESDALRRSMARGTDQWHGELEKAFQDLVNANSLLQETADPERWIDNLMAWDEVHHRFHFALLSNCGSRWLLRIFDMLYDHTTRYRNLSLRDRGSWQQILSEHEVLYSAAIRGDVEAAVAALEEHLARTVKAVSEDLYDTNESDT